MIIDAQDLVGLSFKQSIFVRMLAEDYLGELAYISGFPEDRSPARLHFLGEKATHIQSHVTRHRKTKYLPYHTDIQKNEILEAAKIAAQFHKDYLSELAVQSIHRLATQSVDRILEYVTCLDENGHERTWNRVTFLEGLLAGNQRRWVIAVPDKPLESESGQVVLSTDQIYGQFTSEQQKNWLKLMGDAQATLFSMNVSMKNGEAYDQDKKLQTMLSDFEKDFRRYLMRLTHPPGYGLPEGNQTGADVAAIALLDEPEDRRNSDLLRDSDITSLRMERLAEISFSPFYTERYSIQSHRSPSSLESIPLYSEQTNETTTDTLLVSFFSELRKKFASTIQEPKPVALPPEEESSDDESSVRTSFVSNDIPEVLDMKARMHRMVFRKPVKSNQYQYLSFNLQALPTPISAVEPHVVMHGKEQPLKRSLSDFLLEPSRHLFQRYLSHVPAQQWLIQGEPDTLRTLLFSFIQVYLKETANPWVLLSIPLGQVDLTRLDLSQPFLQQFFSELGYTHEGIKSLKQKYRFLVFFEGLDECPSELLTQRIYFGEETAEWPNAKAIFTANIGWEPPIRPNLQTIQRAELISLTTAKAVEHVENNHEPQELAPVSVDDGMRLSDFFKRYETLITPLIQPFGDEEAIDLLDDSPTAQTKSITKASPVLLNLIDELMPFLSVLPEDQWPKNRHALYACWLNNKVTCQDYLKLQQIAQVLFKNGLPSMQERYTPGLILQNWPFLSGSREAEYHRYVFTQTSWRDYLIARTLWENLYVNPFDGSTLPEQNEWNRWDLKKEYPGVLHFLVEFLIHSDSAQHDAEFLRRQWTANGAMIRWENAYHNVAELLGRYERYNNRRALVPVEPLADWAPVLSEDKAKKEMLNDFMTVVPARELLYVEGTKKSMRMATFDTLGHGGGITGASPAYQKKYELEEQEKRRYIRANAMDRLIGTRLVNRTYELLLEKEEGIEERLSAMVPSYWGFYTKEVEYNKGLLQFEIDVMQRLLNYLTLVQFNFFEKNEQEQEPVLLDYEEALAKWENFRKKDESIWLYQQKETYLTKRESALSGTSTESIAEQKKRAERAEQLHGALLTEITDLVTHLREALNSPIDLDGSTEKKKLQQNAQLTNVWYILQKKKSECEDKIAEFQGSSHNIETRKNDLIDHTHQRFEELMCLSVLGRKKYAQIITNDKDKQRLDAAIQNGNLKVLMDWFRLGFLNDFYAATLKEAQNKIHLVQQEQEVAQKRNAYFLAWITGPAPEALATEWPAIQEAWADCGEIFQEALLNVLQKGDGPAAEKAFSRLFMGNFSPAFKESYQAVVRHATGIEFEIDELPPFLFQHISAHVAWEAMTLYERKQFYRELSGLTISQDGDHCLPFFEKYPQLFLFPSYDYLKRYLRFGLSVDACTDSFHETLLLRALRYLANQYEINGAGDSSKAILFKMIVYLINVGASLHAENTDGETPMKYVALCYSQLSNDKHWKALHTKMQMIQNLRDKGIFVDSVVENAMEKVVDFIEAYKSKSGYDDSATGFMARLNRLLHDPKIGNHRRELIKILPEQVRRIRHDLFYLPENLAKIDSEAKNYPTRVFQGSATKTVRKAVKEVYKGLRWDKPDSKTLTKRDPEPKDSTLVPANRYGQEEKFDANSAKAEIAHLTQERDAERAEAAALLKQKEAEAEAIRQQERAEAAALLKQKEAEAEAIRQQERAEAEALLKQKEAEAEAKLQQERAEAEAKLQQEREAHRILLQFAQTAMLQLKEGEALRGELEQLLPPQAVASGVGSLRGESSSEMFLSRERHERNETIRSKVDKSDENDYTGTVYEHASV